MPDINWSLHASQQVSPAIQQIDEAIKGLGTQTQGSFNQIFNNFAQADSVVNRFNVSIRNTVSASQSANSGLQGLLHTITGFAGGNVLAGIFRDIVSGAKDVAANLITEPARFEQFAAGYVRIFHSVEQAKQHMDEVLQYATQVPQDINQILRLDQMLELITEHTGNLKQRIGQDFNGIRGIIVDTASAMNRDVNSVGNAFIRVFQGATGMGINALQRMGLVSKQELAAQGIEFSANNAKILSSSDQVTAALLNIWQTKFGGMAAVQSNTFNGILGNIKDWGERAALALGGDLFQEAKIHLKEFWDAIRQPEVMATLKDWGDILGRIGHIAWEAFSIAGQAVQNFLTFIRPLTDELGNLLHMLPQVAGSTTGIFDPAAANLNGLIDNSQEFNDIMNQNAADTTQLENKLRGVREAAQDVDYAYGQQTDKLRQQETILDRIYEKQKAARDIATLEKTIAKDKALAVDIFNPEGKAAAERLPDEETRLADMKAAEAQKDQKNAIQDQITLIEDKKKAADRGFQLQERDIQHQIDLLKQQSSLMNQTFNDFTNGQNGIASSGANLDNALTSNKTSVDLLADAIHNLGLETSGLQDTWNNLLLPGLEKAPSKFEEIGKTAGDAAHMLGVDKGFQFVVIDTMRTLHDFWDLIDVMTPRIVDMIGTGLGVLADIAKGIIVTFANAAKVAMNIPNAIATGDSNKLFEGLMDVPDLGKSVQDAINHITDPKGLAATALTELNKRHAKNVQDEINALANDPILGFKNSPYDKSAPENQSEFPSAVNDAAQLSSSSAGNTVTVVTENLCPSCRKKEVLQTIHENRADVADVLGSIIKQRTSR